MACSFATLSLLLDDSDVPQTPPRSPSRLDFCTEDITHGDSTFEADDDPAAHKIDWAYALFRDNCTYKRVEEDADKADTAPRLPIVESDEDDPSQGTDPYPNGATSTSHTFPVPPERQLYRPVIEPRAPTPVRPPSIQCQFDAQEHTHPSRISTQRLNYPHHGFSRSALLHQKSFWNLRHEEWVEWQSHMEQDEAPRRESETNRAYTGIASSQPRVAGSPPPYMRTPPSGLERDLGEHPPRKHEQDVRAPIYPRVGDISALRDPYSVNIDRCFFKFPLWTLHKTLYVFDMFQRSTSLAPSTSGHAVNVPESISSSTLSSYTSATSGDDEHSDDTLVADDSSVTKGEFPLESLSRSSTPPSQSPLSWNHLCAWELSWYARWELLIGLVQRDQTNQETFDISTKLASPVELKVASSSPPGPIFGFSGEDGDEESEDEDEDYGTLVSNPVFGADFEDGYQRAIAFFGRESRGSEGAL